MGGTGTRRDGDRRARRCAGALALACLLWGTLARTAPSAAEIAIARKLFREATASQQARQWSACADKLREAIAIKDTPGLRFHLGHCEENQGNLVEAMVEYDRADELIRLGARAADVKRLVGPAREKLSKRVPTLTVVVPESVDGAKLYVDGDVVAEAVVGRPMPLNPREHHVRVTAPDRTEFKLVVTLGEAEQRVIRADLVSAPTTPSARAVAGEPSPPPKNAGATSRVDSSGSTARTWVLVSEVGLTLAALGAGVGFTVRKGGADDRVARAQAEVDRLSGTDPGACRDPSSPAVRACDALEVAHDERDRDGTFATLGFVGAGVFAVATGATFFLWSAEREPELTSGVTPTRGGVIGSVGGAF